MTEARHSNSNPFDDWKLTIGYEQPRPSDEQNRATAAAWHERQRARTGRPPEINLDDLRAGRLARERRST